MGAQGAATTTIASGRTVIGFDEGFELSGSVDHDGTCTGALEIEIRRRVHGTDSYAIVATTPVTGNGTWGLRVAARRNASYLAQVRDTRDCRGQASGPIDVLVRAGIELDIPGACEAPQRIRGRVRPHHKGTDVLLQRRHRGDWDVVDADRLDRRSRFRLVSDKCTARYRILWPAQDERNLGGVRVFSL